MTGAHDVAIAALAAGQDGLVTRTQLAGAGISPSTIGRRVRSGLLVPVGARTFRLASAASTDARAVRAACLDRGGVASHRTAAWEHGWMELGGTIDVTVRKGRSTCSAAADRRTLRIHTSTDLPAGDIVVVDGIEVTSVARTLLGLAALVPRELSDAQLLDLVSAAIETRSASMPWLRWLLDQRRCQGRNGVSAFARALEARTRLGPTESWLERQLIAVVDEAGLPRPLLQRKVTRAPGRAARVDFLYERERIVVEALGYAFHRTVAQLTADTMRANELQLAGYTVLQITSRLMVEDPGATPRLIARALARRTRDPHRI